MALNKTTREHSLFLNMPLYMILGIYIVLQLLVIVFAVVFPGVSLVPAIVVSLVLIAVTGLLSFLLYKSKNYIASNEQKHELDRGWYDSISTTFEVAQSTISDDLSTRFNKVYEGFRYSDPISNEQTHDIEVLISKTLSDFIASPCPETLAILDNLITQRKALCRRSK